MDPALKAIFRQLNKLSGSPDKLTACQEELIKDISAGQEEHKRNISANQEKLQDLKKDISQQKLAACQKELKDT
jgi:hypothetical protein